MSHKFEYFVVFAEMRTGSNLLETHLNDCDDIRCFGEAFNPNFIGYPNHADLLGVNEDERDRDPMQLLQAIRNHSPETAGFRFFHDHDPRILDTVLSDTLCAKIILTRNPLDSYVSWKIAQATDQWKLTNVAKRKEQNAEFNLQEFTKRLQHLQQFQHLLQRKLQKTGQTCFHISYADLKDLDIINGLAKFLGSQKPLLRLNKKLKPQNPQPLKAKVKNYSQMRSDLSTLDPFILTHTPNFEPRRGASVPRFIAAKESPLLFMPIPSGPAEPIITWLAELDSACPKDLKVNFSQSSLRKWKKQHTAHRSFTVLRHPVLRAHHAFCEKIIHPGENSDPRIRRHLEKNYGLVLPSLDARFSPEQHKEAFEAFLAFLKPNLNLQTNMPVDSHWASQSAIIAGFANFCLPDQMIREHQLQETLAILCAQLGIKAVPKFEASHDETLFWLDQIYDSEIEGAVQETYHRDYIMFGFDKWR